MIPLMPILQESKQKVRPVMDYRELNEHVNAYTANADVCAQTMRSVVKAVIGQDETVSRATSSYVDDIFVNESVCPAAQVKTHLERFGLTCKNPEQLSSGARVLGVYVWEERGKLRWRCDSERPKVSNVLTRRAVFSVCGRLTGHFPVCGWLRVAAAFVKRRANAVTTDPTKGRRKTRPHVASDS